MWHLKGTWLRRSRSIDCERERAEDERKRVASIAAGERQRLNQIMASVPGMVWEAWGPPDSPERKLNFVSAYAEAMSGYSVEEWLSEPELWSSIVHVKDREQVKRQAIATFNAGQRGSYECRWVRKDGKTIWVAAHVAVIKDETGNPIGMRGVTIDITDRKTAEEGLGNNEERYRTRTATDVIIRIDEDSNILFVNAAVEKTFGYMPSELVGQKMTVLMPESLRRCHEEGLRRYLDSGKRRLSWDRISLPGLHKRGQEISMEISLAESRIGEKRLFTGIIRNVTERQQVEQALRESEERLKLAMESARIGYWETDLETGRVTASESLEQIFGLSRGGFVGTVDAFHALVHPEDRERLQRLTERCIKTLGNAEIEYRVVRPDGTVRWVTGRGQALAGAGGRASRLLGMVVDITERKEAEEELRAILRVVQGLKERVEAEKNYLWEEVSRVHRFGEIIGRSEAILSVLKQAEQVAATDATVLLLGETGTGKELLARAIHAWSKRNERSLVKVNCAALPASLIESELFGHERGAFTGAGARRVGRFELADGATIFLDEIGDLPLDLQVKLLRVLQEGEFERLGSSKTIKVDVRVIAATNRDLQRAVQEGKFRKDLYYRLDVYPIKLPPLRERKEDIGPLAVDFLHECALRLGKSFSGLPQTVLESLQRYDWPGNVRELQNVIERAAVTSTGRALRLPPGWEAINVRDSRSDNGNKSIIESRLASNDELSLRQMERRHILDVLDRTHWRIEGRRGAAAVLGLKPSTLRSRMNKLGISRIENKSDSKHAEPTAN
jgi:PAS domain S-box-containing protein